MNEINPMRKPLEILHKDNVSPASEKYVIDTLKSIFQENDDLNNLLNDMFLIGGALFVTNTADRHQGIHSKSGNLRRAAWWKRKIQAATVYSNKTVTWKPCVASLCTGVV